MVATPWGDSNELRLERLSPGPGASSEAVVENQRRRLFGAMVAAVAELGYGATRVTDLSEQSGVSSRSFYDLFPKGKEECFLLVLEEILIQTESALAAAGDSEADWVARLRAIYERFAQMVAAQPATASLVLIEAYAAGPAATKQLDRATAAFERLSRLRLEESPERAGLPATMLQAQVGALQELARTRLGRGEAAVLPLLVPELVELIAGYRPPPERLRLATRRPTFEPEAVASSDEAERVISGFTQVVAEQGYAGATIQDIARQSEMSPNTFYANFRDKREALLATIDSSTAQMAALAMSAYRRSPGWASGVRAMLGSALTFLASHPATANVLLVEIYAGGPEALSVRSRGMRELTRIIDAGASNNPDVPAITPEVISGGLLALARRQLLDQGAESLPTLAPVAAYMALAPYVGSEEACAIANADGRSRPPENVDAQLPQSMNRRSRWAITSMLGARWATVAEIAAELGRPESEVLADLEGLRGEGLSERIDHPGDEKPSEWTNTKRAREIDIEKWALLTADERRDLVADATHLTLGDLSGVIENKELVRRLDEHHTRLLLEVDEQGWIELGEIHQAAFNASKTVRARSERRLRDGEGKTIVGRSIQLLLEVPTDDDHI